MTALTGLRLDLAFIAGAIVSATDPAAVVATFKRIPTPKSLATIVDGESLLNDGTGLVLFSMAVAALATPIGAADAVLGFVGAIAISVAIGVGAGALATVVVRRIDQPFVELAITVVLAYGSFLVADRLGLSGVLATVTAAFIVSNFGDHVLTRERRRRHRHGVGAARVPAHRPRVPAGRRGDVAGSAGRGALADRR